MPGCVRRYAIAPSPMSGRAVPAPGSWEIARCASSISSLYCSSFTAPKRSSVNARAFRMSDFAESVSRTFATHRARRVGCVSSAAHWSSHPLNSAELISV